MKPRARLNFVAGRVWPAGWTLGMPVVGSCACRSWFLMNSKGNTGPIKFKLMQKVHDVRRNETRSLKILLKSFHENYMTCLKKQHGTKINLTPSSSHQRHLLDIC